MLLWAKVSGCHSQLEAFFRPGLSPLDAYCGFSHDVLLGALDALGFGGPVLLDDGEGHLWCCDEKWWVKQCVRLV